MDLNFFYRQKLISNDQIGVPYFNFYKEQEHIGKLLKNNFYRKKDEIRIKEYVNKKFFQNNTSSLLCKKKSKCHDFSFQNDFEFYLCKQTKSLVSFSFFEIFLIILLFILLINGLFE